MTKDIIIGELGGYPAGVVKTTKPVLNEITPVQLKAIMDQFTISEAQKLELTFQGSVENLPSNECK